MAEAKPTPSWLRPLATGVEISIHVQPRAARSQVRGEHGGRLKIQVAAPPVGGAANDELVRFLAELFSVPRQSVEIVGGEGSRQKRVRIASLTPAAALAGSVRFSVSQAAW
ncbi:MAG: DUF167 domain-containing protein [Myxococcales bacterium]